MTVLLRYLLSALFLVSYLLAAGLFSTGDMESLEGLITFIGLVLSIIAVGAMQISHHKDRRSILEVAAVAVCPFICYYMLFQELQPLSASLWIFVGFFNFLVLTGGFFLGIFLSPVLAGLRRVASRRVAETVKGGLDVIKNRNAIGFALLLLAGLVVGFVVYLTRIMGIVEGIPLPQSLAFYALLIAVLLLVVFFSYRHTVLGARPTPAAEAGDAEIG